MENSYRLAIEIANAVCADAFWEYYAQNYQYSFSEDLMRVKETKLKTWGKNFSDGFKKDTEVPIEIKQLHKRVYLKSIEILHKA